MAYEDLKAQAQAIKDEVKIEDYFYNLEKKGLFTFEKSRGTDLYFKKEGQETGSISVTPKNGLWRDFSNDSGGDLFSAAEEFEGIKGFTNQLKHFKLGLTNDPIKYVPNRFEKKAREVKPKKEYEIVKDSLKIEHPLLIKYLKSRGLTPLDAKGVLRELRYKVKGTDKEFFALAQKQPDKEAYTIRNEQFKGNIGKIKPVFYKVGENPTELKAFEGSFDFLSYKKLFPKEEFHAVILNSTSNIGYLEQLSGFQITSYFDNDTAGKKASRELLNVAVGNEFKSKDEHFRLDHVSRYKKEARVMMKGNSVGTVVKLKDLLENLHNDKYEVKINANVKDGSKIYKGFTDLNDYLVDSLEKKKEIKKEVAPVESSKDAVDQSFKNAHYQR